MNNPVTWFEIPATDLDRAQKFYEATLGVKLDRQNMPGIEMAWFPMEMNGPGAAGTLAKAEGYTPSHAGTMIYFSVADIEATLKLAGSSGGKVLQPKMSIGQYGFIGIFEDSEGNRVGLHSKD